MTANPTAQVGSEAAPTPTAMKLPCKASQDGQPYRELAAEDLSSFKIQGMQKRRVKQGFVRSLPGGVLSLPGFCLC